MPLVTLLVEDNPTIRDNLIAALGELTDVSVVATADSATQALAVLAEHAGWELTVLDLFLKEGSGLTVLRACQGRPAWQHILILTNYPTAEIRRRCVELGADGVYDKSTELDAFFERCNAYARNRRQP
jgi:DNA-binding NarL/FixJ family response regulator